MTDEIKGKDGDDSGKLLYCSFCGKSQDEVRKLIAGPSVFICDECVDLCNDIIREEIQDVEPQENGDQLPTPSELSAALDEYVIGQERAKKFLPLQYITTTSGCAFRKAVPVKLSWARVIFCLLVQPVAVKRYWHRHLLAY